TWLTVALSAAVFWMVKPTLGTRNCLASGSVGYAATRSGREVKMTSRWTGIGSGRFQAMVRALALPNGVQPCAIATRWMPPERSIDQETASALLPPMVSITV